MSQPGLPERNHVAVESLIGDSASWKIHFYITPGPLQETRLRLEKKIKKSLLNKIHIVILR